MQGLGAFGAMGGGGGMAFGGGGATTASGRGAGVAPDIPGGSPPPPGVVPLDLPDGSKLTRAGTQLKVIAVRKPAQAEWVRAGSCTASLSTHL